MPVSIRLVGTFVLACVVSVTIGVVTAVLVDTMNKNTDDMVDASSVMADEFAEMFLTERTANMREQVGEHIFGPVQHMIMLGTTPFKLYNLNGSSLTDALRTCRSMISLADQLDEPRFITEVNFVSYKNATPTSPVPELATSLHIGDHAGDMWTVNLFDHASKVVRIYNDSVPFPVTAEREVPLVENFLLAGHLDHEFHFSRSWSSPRLVANGILRISHASPLKSGPAYNSPWVLSDFSLDFVRSLLQGMAGAKGEVFSQLGYSDPNYVPVLDESILCVVDPTTGELIACTHGFATVNNSNTWSRVVANESEHPVIGPIMSQIDLGAIHSETLKLSTSGTARFPIATQSYFVKAIALAHAHHDEEEHHEEEGHEEDHHEEEEDHEDEGHEGEEEGHDEVNASPPWIGIAIVPRSILLATFEKTIDDVEESGDRGLIVALIVAFGILVFAVICVYAYESAVVRPLVRLMGDMKEVEQMNIDHLGDSYRSETTMFTEVNHMRESFVAMVDMLIEYKAFMPSYLVGTDKDESEAEIKTAEHRSVASGLTTLSASTVVVPAAKNLMFALELHRHHCSFLTAALSIDDGVSSSNGYNHFISVLLSTGSKLHPQVTVSGKFIQVAFNSPVKIMAFSDKGLSCAQHIERENFSFVKGLSYEVSEVEAGNIGCSQQKYFLIRSNQVVESKALSLYASSKKLSYIVCNEAVTMPRYSGTQFSFAALDVINVGSLDPVVVYRVLGLRKIQDEEWMYTMNSEEGSNLSKFNKGFSFLISGQMDEARECLECCRGSTFANLDVLLRAVQSGTPYKGVFFNPWQIETPYG